MKDYEKLARLATEELEKLNVILTQEYRDKLKGLGYIKPESSFDCLYGALTGECTSDKAIEMMNLCAPGVYSAPSSSTGTFQDYIPNESRPQSNNHYFTPLEAFIMLASDEDVRSAVNYLKLGNVELPKFDTSKWYNDLLDVCYRQIILS